jgi:flagellar protein FlaG
MINMSSLNINKIHLQEGNRPSQRARQGTGQSEGLRASSANEPPVDVQQAEALAAQMNEVLKRIEGNYSVSVDQATGMVVVRITDTETGEIVKQVPPQQILDINVSMEKIIGLLVNDQA